MAIFSMNEKYEENELFDESGDILDNMLEACDQMMDALGESTAAQRHFKVTSKDIKENPDKGGPYYKALEKVAGNKIAGKSFAKNCGKNYHNGSIDKTFEKLSDKEEKSAMPYGDIFYNHRTDNQKEAIKYGNKALVKGMHGAILNKAANSGVPVKKIYDKAANKAEKKKAIKETCLTILSMIDDI